jgi:hypothetical protein
LVADAQVVDAEGAAAAGRACPELVEGSRRSRVSVPVKLAGMVRLYSVKPELAVGWKTAILLPLKPVSSPVM